MPRTNRQLSKGFIPTYWFLLNAFVVNIDLSDLCLLYKLYDLKTQKSILFVKKLSKRLKMTAADRNYDLIYFHIKQA